MSTSNYERRHSAVVPTAKSKNTENKDEFSRRVSLGTKIDQIKPLSFESKHRWSNNKDVKPAFVVNSPNFWKTQSPLDAKQTRLNLNLEKNTLNSEKKDPKLINDKDAENSKPGSWKSEINKRKSFDLQAKADEEKNWKEEIFKRKERLLNKQSRSRENMKLVTEETKEVTNTKECLESDECITTSTDDANSSKVYKSSKSKPTQSN